MSRHRRSRRGSFAPAGPRRPDRKTLQLCSQVADALNYVLSGELDDDVLRNYYVARVEPAPSASRLLVSVSPLDRDDETPTERVLKRLHEAAPTLRREVAASTNRRKTPELAFIVVQPDEPGQT
jgi:ribosome-binding factor A